MDDPKLNCRNCGTHIDEHEAGPCLDSWVQNYVLDSKAKKVKPYSTDANLSMEIIKRCWYVAMKYVTVLNESAIQVTIYPARADFKYTSTDDLLSLAVCRAAIKAVAEQHRWQKYL